MQLKKSFLFLSFILLHFTASAQALCVVDGWVVSDSILEVTLDEMRSDDAPKIIADRINGISKYAIQSVSVYDRDSLLNKSVAFCRQGRDVVIIRTNSLAFFDWVIDGKQVNPKYPLNVIEYKIHPELLHKSLPRGLNEKNIKDISIVFRNGEVRPEARSTIYITTRRSKH